MNNTVITNKNNALTDGFIPSTKLTASKLINILNYYYEHEGVEFEIKFLDLYKQLGYSNIASSKQLVLEAFKILQQPIFLRNFTYQGKNISWITASYLSQVYVEKKYRNIFKIKLNEMIIEALKQKNFYTQIDLNIAKNFKTKYGLIVWEIYLRYKNQHRKNISNGYTYQNFSIDYLNQKFGTKHKYASKILECTNRATREVYKITQVHIDIFYDKKDKIFTFAWQKENKKTSHNRHRYKFIKFIRENLIDTPLLTVIKQKETATKLAVTTSIACNEKGYLYDIKEHHRAITTNTKERYFTKEQANKYWDLIFKDRENLKEYQDKINV